MYQHKNISRAADELQFTPQNVSQAIRELERQLDIKRLFVKAQRGVRPTEEAERIYPIIVNALGLMAKAEQELKTFDENSEWTIKLRCPSHMAKFAILKCIKTFREKYPRVRFIIVNTDVETSLSDLENNKLDLLITLSPVKVQADNLVSVVLKDYEHTLFATQAFLDKNGITNVISVAQLKNLPFILPYKSKYTLFNINPIIAPASVEMMYDAVLDGMGVGAAINDYLTNKPVVKLTLSDGRLLEQTLQCLYNKNTINKATIAFVKTLFNYFNIN